jgi:UDP-N-acetylglucosamine 1-carboxyvinyltransferase
LRNNNNGRKIIIEGPTVLKGKVNISGSKNAVLPILAATLMTQEKCTIRNVPDLSDITTMISMLEILGKKVERKDSFVEVEEGTELHGEAPYDLVKKMRASILVMGALAGRKRKIRVPLPGGCAIGTRPVDIHLKGLKRMGAKFSVSEGCVNLSSKKLTGTTFYLDYPSVGATENLVMAACQAEGETILENISREPEVLEFLSFLKAMGADISEHENTLKIQGRRNYRSVDFTVMDDRIQAGTYLMAGCLKNSKLEIDFSHPEVLEAIIEKLIECGADIEVEGRIIKVSGNSRLKNSEVRTAPYPGFPTDLQAPYMALMSVSKGVSVMSEEVFENRFLHCAELIRMGANIEIRGNLAVITGVKHLGSAPVTAMDLRGGAALIIAGLLAKGRTEISGVDHIDRGYEYVVENFRNLGANIWTE